MSRCLLFYGQALKILLICHFDEAFFVADPVSKRDMNMKRVSRRSEDLGKHASDQGFFQFFVSACSVFFHGTEVSFPKL